MIFHYTAALPNGKIIEDNIEADSSGQVLLFLNNKGLKPISIKIAGGQTLLEKLGFSSKKISSMDKIFLTKYLGLMLKVGTGLLQAIDILISDTQKPSLKSILIEIKTNLQKGNSFYITFARYPQTFSPVFINLIKAGEASGRLDKTFEDLSESLEKEEEIKSKIKSALTYPIILLFSSLLIFTLLITFAIPKLTAIFMASNVKPPLFTQAVIALSNFSISAGPYLLSLFIIFVIALFVFYKRSRTGKTFIKRMIYRIPLIKTVILKRALQRLCHNLSDLLSSGLALIESIELAAKTAGHPEIQSSLERIAREDITQGLTLGESFRHEPIFPNTLINLVVISEKTGHLSELLKTLGNFYSSEIDSSIKTMVSFLEPALLFFIAFIVGGIALSVIVPIYQMIGQF